jgi:predicted nucleotidyltransferase
MDKDAVIAVLRTHRAELQKLGVKHAALFGSVARGEAGPNSDIDIALDFDAANIPTVYQFVGMAERVQELFEGHVDVIDRKALRPAIAVNVERDIIDAF